MQAHGETRFVEGVSLRGFRGGQIILRELCACIKYLSLGEPPLEAGVFDIQKSPFSAKIGEGGLECVSKSKRMQFRVD